MIYIFILCIHNIKINIQTLHMVVYRFGTFRNHELYQIIHFHLFK